MEENVSKLNSDAELFQTPELNVSKSASLFEMVVCEYWLNISTLEFYDVGCF